MIRWLLVAIGLCCAGCATTQPSADGLPPSAREHPENFVVVTVRNDAVPTSTRAGSTPRGYDGVGYGPGAYARDAVRALAATYRLDEVSGWPIAELGVHCVVFRIPSDTHLSEVLDRLKQDSRVESAQPLNVFATRGSSYNDPYEDLQGNLGRMGVEEAHRWSRGSGVHVAVIDTGADVTHPDLAGRVVEQQNFVDNDMAAFKHDRHGTAIAGVIAADSNNSIGIVGIAPEARLHIYKTCWQQEAGAACNTFTLAKGLAAAINARVQIVNLSLAGPEDPLLSRLVIRGQERGLIFVGAMPPGANSAEALAAFPVGVPGVLRVAAAETQSADTSALHAPGVDVLTLAPQGRYDFLSGNSLATAGVTGTIALLLSRDRSASAERLHQLLATSTVGTQGGVDACAALAQLLHEGPCDQPVAAE
ncbi:MAG: S8 family peptidase [Povalibacter sp.]